MALATKIREIQVLRGLAVLGVCIYHYFGSQVQVNSRWNFFSNFDYGVNLFFIISGYVISMSIQRKRNFFTFIAARLVRLYPAVFFLVPLAYLAGLYTNLKNGRILPQNLIPSLLLFDPNVLSNITGAHHQYVIDVMWSISVEIYFYSLLGFLFFIFKKNMNTMLYTLILLSLVSSLARYIRYIGVQSNPLEFFLKFSDLFGWGTLIYFTIGVLFYLRKSYDIIKKWHVILILIVNLVVAEKITNGGSMIGLVKGSVVVMLFLAVQKLRITWIGLVWIGDASYEIYLLHNPILSFVQNRFPSVDNSLYSTLLMIFILLVVLFISILISEFYSKPMIFKLKTYYSL